MAAGYFFGYIRTRDYVEEFHRINARWFKSVIDAEKGKYKLNADWLNDEHKEFQVFEHPDYTRLMLFNIQGRDFPVPLQLHDSGAAPKIYLVCPCCTEKKQQLFYSKKGFFCRKCLKLHYFCQSATRHERLARRIIKLRKKTWGDDYPDIYNLFEQAHHWPKPKGLHHSTFIKIIGELRDLENECMKITEQRFGRVF